MQRLLDDAEKISGIEYDISSFADITDAIHVVQTEMGITGTTAKEAASTIQGSVGMMKSAWANLVTGIADENADLEKLITNFVDSVGVTVENVLPKIHTVLVGSAKLVENLIPAIMAEIPVLINNTLPQILTAGVNVIKAILNGIASNPNEIVNTILNVMDILINSFVDLAPELLVTGAIILGKLAVGLIQAIPDLVKKVPTIIKNLVESFTNVESVKRFLQVGKDFVSTVGEGIKSMLSRAKTWGKDLLENFISGIKEKINKLKDTVVGVAKSIKDFLGFSEPEKGPLSNFHTYAPDMMDLFAKGIRDNEDVITDQIEKSFDFGERTMKFGAEYGGGYGTGVAGGAFGGTSIGNITININGARYENEHSLAEAIAEELQALTERKAAVYA